MDYFKETEELLYSVQKKERAITQMEKRKARLMAKGAPTIPAGLDYTKPYVKASFADETINDLCELAHVCACIEATRQELEEIKNCVEEIADAELKKCLKLWYWARLPKEKIAEKIDRWSVTTVYAKRNAAIHEFALIYWGAKVK